MLDLNFDTLLFVVTFDIVSYYRFINIDTGEGVDEFDNINFVHMLTVGNLDVDIETYHPS
jgi:hypothetical protein